MSNNRINTPFFWDLIKPFKRKYLLGLISLGIVDVCELFPPLLIKSAIDTIGKQNAMSIIKWIAFGYVGVYIVQGIFRYAFRQFFGRTSFSATNRLMKIIYRHLSKLSASYFDRTRTGEIMSRCTNDVQAVRLFLGPGLLISCDTLFYLIVIPPVMFYMSWKLSLFTLCLFPVLPVFVHRVGNIIHRRFERVQSILARATTFAQENISGVRVIRAYVQEESEIKGFEIINREYMDMNLSLQRVQTMFHPALHFATGIGAFLVIFLGGREVLQGNLSLGEFVAFQAYLLKLMWPMVALGWTISLYQRGRASMNRIQEILDKKPEINDEGVIARVDVIVGDIEFKNLNFTYNGNGDDVLKNISLKIKAGTSLGIVGPIGSGKSTLVNLIPRLYQSPENSVFIDNMDVQEIPLDILRNNIGIVPQEPFLFSDSIAENIALGRPGASPGEIAKYAKLASMEKEIEEFPEQYQTMLGERGINLSGGQKQRLTIARALIKDPRILILDDCLSSVDTKTEEQILNNLHEIMCNRTTLIVSHRISTVKNADRIIVLKNGEIVQDGVHEELIQQEGLYAYLHRHQLLREELEIS